MKILTLGYFGYHNGQLDGQTVKTRNVYELLEQHIGGTKYFDTQELKNNKAKVLKMIYMFCKADIVFYIAAQGSIKYLFPILYILSIICQVQINYIQIGGSLQNVLKTRAIHTYMFRHIANIFAEIPFTKKTLEKEFNFKNVSTLPNFRITNFMPKPPVIHDGLKCVFFSRIMKQKGIEMVFSFAETIEQSKAEISIDFYGQINPEDKQYFEEQIKNHTCTNYKGALQPAIIHSTLSNYDVLLFPTFYKEGFPGCILDAYIAGIPIISSNFLSARDFIDDGKTGLIFEYKDQDAMNQNVMTLANDPKRLLEMKQYAAKKSHEYSADIAWNTIWEKAIR